jgi:hypothetical protein
MAASTPVPLHCCQCSNASLPASSLDPPPLSLFLTQPNKASQQFFLRQKLDTTNASELDEPKLGILIFRTNGSHGHRAYPSVVKGPSSVAALVRLPMFSLMQSTILA